MSHPTCARGDAIYEHTHVCVCRCRPPCGGMKTSHLTPTTPPTVSQVVAKRLALLPHTARATAARSAHARARATACYIRRPVDPPSTRSHYASAARVASARGFFARLGGWLPTDSASVSIGAARRSHMRPGCGRSCPGRARTPRCTGVRRACTRTARAATYM
jgi:hypothetical protein